MTDTLFQAYLPLLVWTSLGLLLFRWLPKDFPRWLGRSLYWVGIPLEILTLARQTQLSDSVGITPIVAIAALGGGLALAWISLQAMQWRATHHNPAASIPAAITDAWQSRSRWGSFLISSMIGNTGFVGLAIAPTLVDEAYLSWIVFYSVTNNIIGTYGIGVALASYFGRSDKNQGWVQVRDVLTVPSLWAFAIGSSTRSIDLPVWVESGLHHSIWVVIPAALLLMGMRLSQLQGWKSLRLAIVPTLLKVGVIPALVGIGALLLGLPAAPRLVLVLMSGMPTAFAGLILAEEYELDRELIASSILLTTVTLLFAIPLWLVLFG